jgi:hypothetical protein
VREQSGKREKGKREKGSVDILGLAASKAKSRSFTPPKPPFGKLRAGGMTKW